jgi:hypothetical protein
MIQHYSIAATQRVKAINKVMNKVMDFDKASWEWHKATTNPEAWKLIEEEELRKTQENSDEKENSETK